MEFKKKNIKDNHEENQSHYITILTYNVWCEEKYLQERTNRIIDLVKQYEPDVVCFQELTDESFKIINSKLDELYYIFQIFTSEKQPYGCGLACKRDTSKIIDQPYYYDFNNTRMNRRIIGCEVKIGEHNFHVLTTHLESLPKNDHLRSLQFDTISKVMEPLNNIILCGDFNILTDTEDINQKIANSKLSDSWIEIGCPSKIAYTYNYKKNKNIQNKFQNRLDRIYYTTKNLNMKPKRMALIGISETGVGIPPSDHFGLLVEFSVNEEDED